MDKLLLEYTNTEPTESRSNQDIVDMLNRRENKGVDELSSNSPRAGEKRKGLKDMEIGGGSGGFENTFGQFSNLTNGNLKESLTASEDQFSGGQVPVSKGTCLDSKQLSFETGTHFSAPRFPVVVKTDDSSLDDLESIIRSNEIIPGNES